MARLCQKRINDFGKKYKLCDYGVRVAADFRQRHAPERPIKRRIPVLRGFPQILLNCPTF